MLEELIGYHLLMRCFGFAEQRVCKTRESHCTQLGWKALVLVEEELAADESAGTASSRA